MTLAQLIAQFRADADDADPIPLLETGSRRVRSADQGHTVAIACPPAGKVLDVDLGAAALGIGGVAPVEDDDVHRLTVRGARCARAAFPLG